MEPQISSPHFECTEALSGGYGDAYFGKAVKKLSLKSYEATVVHEYVAKVESKSPLYSNISFLFSKCKLIDCI